MSFDELRRSWIVLGPGDRPGWDREWRSRLLDHFELLTRQLWSVGIDEVYIGGSFAGVGDRPADIDGYFNCDRVAYKNRSLHRALNEVAPVPVWTWRKEHRRPNLAGELKLPMWHHYRVELFPDYGQAAARLAGPDGKAMDFADLFRRTREDPLSRGVIKIIPGCS